jgi:hypothetical protein
LRRPTDRLRDLLPHELRRRRRRRRPQLSPGTSALDPANPWSSITERPARSVDDSSDNPFRLSVRLTCAFSFAIVNQEISVLNNNFHCPVYTVINNAFYNY